MDRAPPKKMASVVLQPQDHGYLVAQGDHENDFDGADENDPQSHLAYPVPAKVQTQCKKQQDQPEVCQEANAFDVADRRLYSEHR